MANARPEPRGFADFLGDRNRLRGLAGAGAGGP
jgi:hypothetical protein